MADTASERPSPLPAACAFAATAFVLAGRLWPASPLVDAVDGAPFHDASLVFPAGYLALAPFSALADLVSFTGARQAPAWVAWLLGAWFLAAPLRPRRSFARAAAGFAGWTALVVLFLAWALLLPRPMARLSAAEPREQLVVDFHSHSACSHDGRRSFGPRANAAWHEEAGFDAGFLTDHNTERCSRVFPAVRGYAPLSGVELSLHGAHVVALSPRAVIPVEGYQAGQAGLESFLSDVRRVHGAAAVLSLPEYWRYHRGDLARLMDLAGVGSGVELANGAPKALDVPFAARAEAGNLARTRGLFAACATDQHGWSRAAYCWNLVEVPGWRNLSRDALEAAVLARLRAGGAGAVRVAARRRVETSPGALVALDPLMGLWTLCRTLTPGLSALCILWAWALCGAWRSFPWSRPRRALLTRLGPKA